MKQSPNLFIKYIPHPNSDIDLNLLGESLIGFERVIKQFFILSKIDGNLEVKAKNVSSGSIIIEIALQISAEIPFNTVSDLLAFYKIAEPTLHIQAATFFANFNNIHKTANDFVAQYPFDFALVCWFISKLIGYAKRQKNGVCITDENGQELEEKPYAKALHRLISKEKIFKKALKPFIEDELSSVQVSPERNFNISTEISTQNFENYLPEDARILPEYQNGQKVKLSGKLVGLQKSKGDSMTIRVHDIEKNYSLLVAYPDESHDTKDCLQFYGKDILFEAEILRKSLYQKPKLKIIGMPSLLQTTLFKE